MASHGKQRHLKRPNVSLSTGLSRKGSLWMKKPLPGKHPSSEAIPLVSLLRDKMKLAESSRQVRKLLTQGEVLIDGEKAKDLGTPVGLMDVVSIPKIGKSYRIIVSKGKLVLKEITSDKTGVKYCRINGKTINKKGKVQLNLHDSRVMLIEKEEDRFKVGDTILVSVPNQEMKGFLKMEKGAPCLVFKGRHSGELAVLEEILSREGSKPADARLTTEGKELITLKNYLFVVDKDFKV